MDKHTVLIGASEEWEAPDAPTAERWRDEVIARGGAANILASWNSQDGRRWFVRIVANSDAPTPLNKQVDKQ